MQQRVEGQQLEGVGRGSGRVIGRVISLQQKTQGLWAYNCVESQGAITTFEQILLREVATLPEERRADALAFVRFLKISLPDEEKVRAEFKEALEDARATADKYNITEEDINAEIRAVRDGK